MSLTTSTSNALHDATEFSFTGNTPDGAGYLISVEGRHRTRMACGVLLRAGLV